jgi:TrpR-related protein YerC/YecD
LKGGVNLNEKLKTKNTELLFNAILSLESIEECYAFFEDLCTVKEIKAISQRIAVARMLREKIIFTEITELTGASSATISRVNRALTNGCDGYELVLSRMEAKKDE